MITEEMIQDLAYKIWENITNEFDYIHPVSGNLTSTSYIEPTEKGLRIVIPAERYNKEMYDKWNVIVYTGEGSYAQEVDDLAGYQKKDFPHDNYVMRNILKGMRNWLMKNNLKGDIRIE